MVHMEMCGKAVKMMSKIERNVDKFDSNSSDEDKTREILSCQFPFVHFFQLILFVSDNAENKSLFVTQFVFYLMVLFVPAANKGKVTQWENTPRILHIEWTLHYSGSIRDNAKDL